MLLPTVLYFKIHLERSKVTKMLFRQSEVLNFGCEMPPNPPNKAPPKYCFYHQPTEKSPLGETCIAPDQDGKTVMELLGLSDKDVQNKFNQFNLGGSKLIKFQNYKEARQANVLT
jgi:hypothetical protein